ncbi:MAG: hypothetical protein JNM41_15900 [Flavipsychrobacter sp.]|nr:hypothetical protein [Flavipsychrobacter sp.]
MPENATGLGYGALLSGTGTIWFDDIKFEVVNVTVPVTGKELPMQATPANLSFDE